MHGCMTEYVVCNHPRADGRIAVVVICIFQTNSPPLSTDRRLNDKPSMSVIELPALLA